MDEQITELAREKFLEQPARSLGGTAVTRENYEELIGAPAAAWPQFQKRVPTSAVNIVGPFTVATSEGTLTCEDGWLCLDARGYPYPVARDEFELIYQPWPPMLQTDEEPDGWGPSVVGLLLEAQAKAKAKLEEAPSGEAKREFALANTAIEDAMMRYTRGRARELDVFKPADLDSEEALRDRFIGRSLAARAQP